jgi:hypothetical protein
MIDFESPEFKDFMNRFRQLCLRASVLDDKSLEGITSAHQVVMGAVKDCMTRELAPSEREKLSGAIESIRR